VKDDQLTLLFNGTFWPAMGHAVEALKYAYGYKVANRGLRISIVLNSETTVQLAKLCPWIDEVYQVPIRGDRDVCHGEFLQQVPKAWTFLIGEPRLAPPIVYDHRVFQSFHRQLSAHVDAEVARGFAGDGTLPYEEPGRLQIDLSAAPREAQQIIAGVESGRKGVAVLLAGGSWEPHFWPSWESWRDILLAIQRGSPDASFFLLGNNRSDNPHLKTQYLPGDADALLACGLPMIDCREIGLLGQLSVVKFCKLFVSPHTGFGFGAVAVGTPWLTISGGKFKEHFFNGVPFYSALQDRERYPAFTEAAVEPVIDSDGTLRIPSMRRQRFIECASEISDVSAKLIGAQYDYKTWLSLHFSKMHLYETGNYNWKSVNDDFLR